MCLRDGHLALDLLGMLARSGRRPKREARLPKLDAEPNNFVVHENWRRAAFACADLTNRSVSLVRIAVFARRACQSTFEGQRRRFSKT
jgi:hypothetical protein